MSYGLGAAPAADRIDVGQLVQTDPIMSASSLMASRLILQSIRQPKAARLRWLRRELNKSQPGLGTDTVSKVRELMRRGKSPNQALFDGLRLTLANFFAKRFKEIQRAGGSVLRGLGGSVGDIRAVGCTIMGTIGTGGATASALMTNPAGSGAIGEATVDIMGANSCNADAIRAQADVINAQAALAAAQGPIIPSSNLPIIAAVGIGATVVIGGALFFALKK